MLKSDIVADTDVCAKGTMLPAAITCTVPPVKPWGIPVALPVGVTTIVTVAVDPAWREGKLQLTMTLVETPPHVPELTLAELNVRGTPVTLELKLSIRVMLFARSGPPFCTM
jgi:hypothetical protein